MTEEIRLVPRSLIDPNPYQPRQHFAEEALTELAASIREHGIIQPLVLRPVNGRYQCIAGERRLRAAGLAGLEQVPAVIRSFADQTALEAAIVENIQREDLSPVESARAYLRLTEEFGYTQGRIAQRTGKSRAGVNNTLRLLQLPDRVLEMVERGELTEGHARVLLGLPSPTLQQELGDWVARNALTVREAEEKVRELQERGQRRAQKASAPRAAKPASVHVRDLEDRLRSRFGTKVGVIYRSGKGSIQIEFYSDEDLERILELVGVREVP